MMPAKKPDAAALVDLMIARAADLRAAGITSLSLDGIAVTLAAAAPEEPEAEPGDDSPPEPIDPLNDPSTYPGGKVPGFTRPKKET